MQTTRLAILPVKVLWEYREFKRDELPAPRIPYIHGHSLDEIIQYVSVNGFEPVELSVVRNLALLTDGNHRIIAALRLGVEHIPVNITVYFGDGSDAFYDHTLNRFHPITTALEYELKKIFINEDLIDNPDAWGSRFVPPEGRE